MENHYWTENKYLQGVCVLVILYKPTQRQLNCLNSLSTVNIPIIAVDNSSYVSQVNEGIIYIPLYENKGIAAAQNIGIHEAKRRQYQYIIFFDQDSEIENSYINQITREYVRIKKMEYNVATVGPLIIDRSSRLPVKNYTSNSGEYEEVINIVSSGSIIETKTFDYVGLFEERLFIDLVDSEWCWRAKSKGLNTYMSKNVHLYHSIGKKYKKIGPLFCNPSSAFRYYYQYRNTIWMLYRDYVPFRWKYRTVLRKIVDMFIYPFMSDDALFALKQMLKGIYHGFTQR